MGNTYFEQIQDALRQLIVKVGVFGRAHVVDEYKAGVLCFDALQRRVQLIDDTLQCGAVADVFRIMLVCGE